jgi:hypothetical protein
MYDEYIYNGIQYQRFISNSETPVQKLNEERSIRAEMFKTTSTHVWWTRDISIHHCYAYQCVNKDGDITHAIDGGSQYVCVGFCI